MCFLFKSYKHRTIGYDLQLIADCTQEEIITCLCDISRNMQQVISVRQISCRLLLNYSSLIIRDPEILPQ